MKHTGTTPIARDFRLSAVGPPSYSSTQKPNPFALARRLLHRTGVLIFEVRERVSAEEWDELLRDWTENYRDYLPEESPPLKPRRFRPLYQPRPGQDKK